jgi:hypothetical protein
MAKSARVSEIANRADSDTIDHQLQTMWVQAFWRGRLSGH